jgi:DNA-binding NtrC family response regulator
MTATPAPVPATRSHILVIEDEPSVAAFVRAALERHGYEVTSSSSAVEGLRLLALHDFRGVISDFRTPGGITGSDVNIHT